LWSLGNGKMLQSVSTNTCEDDQSNHIVPHTWHVHGIQKISIHVPFTDWDFMKYDDVYYGNVS